MNRIDRVSAILVQLQSKRIVKAQDIANRFHISLRTVYRDIKTLEEAGVPIIGEAGVGYSIAEGYRLPPVMFTREEAMAFLTAEKLVEKLTDAGTRSSYESAMYKVKAVLRWSEKEQLDHLSNHIVVTESPYFSEHPAHSAFIQPILQAINQKEALQITYRADHALQETIRTIEPVGIYFMSRYWYLLAWCNLRNDYRVFKTARIRQLQPTNQFFTSEHPSLQQYLTTLTHQQPLSRVVIQVKRAVVKYLSEQKYYCGFVAEQDLGEYIEMTFLTAAVEGFVRWYLMFAAEARIISPADLNQLVADQLAAIQLNLDLPAPC